VTQCQFINADMGWHTARTMTSRQGACPV
jgi:hypothetical protein